MNAHLIYRFALRGTLALAFSFAVGCAVDAETAAEDPELRGTEEAGEATENVAEAQEELTACYDVLHHGGDAFERTFTTIMGCDCGAGYIRDFYNVWNDGHGSCSAVGWASPDPHDCRVKVSVKNSAGFLWGDCNAQVEKIPACSHSKCTTGQQLSASDCGTAVTSVCAADPYCCNTAWDGVCVNEVRTVANSLACVNTCAHSLCTTGTKLTSGCDAAQGNCVANICAVDPYCCNNSWDSVCVGEIASVCGKNCN